MTMSLDFLAAFVMGIAGSGHCLAMCGGLAGAVGFQRSLKQLFIYNFGRIISYMLAGVIVGTLTFGLELVHQQTLIYFRVLAGIMMLLLAVYLLRVTRVLLWVEKMGSYLWRYIQPLSKHTKNLPGGLAIFASGMIWGWLPCGLVYSALTWSAAGSTIIDSALFMLLFGLGTLPSMISVGVFSSKLQQFMKSGTFRWTFSFVLAVYGVQTIYVGVMQLH
ncbi:MULTISPECIES: sulfite exporter TauE/SafE family protein [Gammaproteobacteria]|uniref:sulfite exporter TauE/SafE family protein n=1 Tax=Gammaproteobacteria TaxID=1236 RepID=UPI000DD08DF0|nr:MULTISPECIES: sulfite exporter TauE/SafE family protein [Gammaproteobacteria]RTE87246.1 sulfite exporter TauE/SafE family protein [Aliidiomarina sp. B3213]TCZ92967.1 sulfite exporter TauE/SafE family protein [Lysobacter sp. N42]